MATGRQHVEDGLHNPSQCHCSGPASMRRRGHERFDQGPFGIGEVACVAQSNPAISLPSDFSPGHCDSVCCCKPTESHPTEIAQLSFSVRLSDLSGASGPRHRLCAGARLGRSAFSVQALARQGFRSGQSHCRFRRFDRGEEEARLGKTARNLATLLVAATGCDLARELQAKIGRARDQLLTFCDYPGEVDVTNNTSERKLRPCVIQRKMANGYHAMWAAQAEADVRTTIDTARLAGGNPFDVILETLA